MAKRRTRSDDDDDKPRRKHKGTSPHLIWFGAVVGLILGAAATGARWPAGQRVAVAFGRSIASIDIDLNGANATPTPTDTTTPTEETP